MAVMKVWDGTQWVRVDVGVFLNSGQITSGYLGDASVVSGSVGSGQLASGHMASGFIAGLFTTRHLYGFTQAWLSSNTISVGSTDFSSPVSVCRDKANANNITLSGAIVINSTLSGGGGVDTSPLTGTVFTVSGATLVSGSATAFLTDFTSRSGLGAVAASGTNLIGFSGPSFVNLNVVAINDLIGTPSGYFSVTSVNSGVLTITSGFIASGTFVSVIESPTFGFSGTYTTVNAIYTNTSMRVSSGAPGTISGTGIKGGPAPGVFMYSWVGAGASGTTCYLSTQRTTPYGV